ncbi:winged helix-turn-helix transcriptional regulator [Serratia ureilytica]
MAYPGDVYSGKCSGARCAGADFRQVGDADPARAGAAADAQRGEPPRRIDGISQKVLTQTLRQLNATGCSERLDLSERNQAHVDSWLQRRRLLAGRDADGAGPMGEIPFPRVGRRPRAVMMPTASARPIKAVCGKRGAIESADEGACSPSRHPLSIVKSIRR